MSRLLIFLPITLLSLAMTPLGSYYNNTPLGGHARLGYLQAFELYAQTLGTDVEQFVGKFGPEPIGQLMQYHIVQPAVLTTGSLPAKLKARSELPGFDLTIIK